MPTDICRWLFLLYFMATWAPFTNSKEVRVVCYYTNWSVYRPGTAKFSPQNINPYLCTHLIYAFGGFTKENTLKPFDKYQDIEKGGYAKFTGLKTYNKNLKTMLAIGGWNEGSSRFSPMVANAERREELVKNAIKFLRQNHFDGLDLDWEYPSFRDGGKPRDRDNYAQLVQELREEFDREAEKTGRPRLLLTMAVPAGIEYINKGYDVPKLNKYLDWMNILSYDYHSAFEPAVNHHAPLFPLEEPSEYNYDTELNIDYTIKHYLKLGADPNKLVMGIPTYGRSYTLFNPDANEIGSPADGPGDMGDATRENGYLAYYEICDNVKNHDWEVVQPNPDAMGPYAFKDNQWVGYDDVDIARRKSQYVAENGLGGIMFWSIDNDDFRGNCHGKSYPIIEAAKEALISAYGFTDDNLISPHSKTSKTKAKSRTRVTTEESVPDTPTRRSRFKTKTSSPIISSRAKSRRKDLKRTTEGPVYSSLELVTPSYTTPEPPAIPDGGGVFKCEDEGFYEHPKDCKKYFWCLSGPGDSGIIAHAFTCPAGLYFNKAADSCDYTRNVVCNKKPKASTTTSTSSTTEATSRTTTTSRSTSRVPPRITAATAKTTVFRTSTTTESSFEDEYEYEDDDDFGINAEEDPRVIKELLNLIKKAGGIEQLEKQLKIHEDGTASLSDPSSATTPSSISKTLVQKVLNSRKYPYSTINRNSRGPQNEGLSKADRTTKERGRPQYTTITRARSHDAEEEDTDADDEVGTDDAETDKKTSKKIRQPEYVNIRRPRVSTTTEEPEDNSKNQLHRNKILGEEDDQDDIEDDEDDKPKASTPQYVNIRRQRPTTEETSTSKYTIIRRGSTTTESADDDSLQNSRTRGTTTETTIENGSSSGKRRGTTTASTTDDVTEDKNRLSTTPSSANQDANDLKSKYKTISRGTTTAAASLSTSSNDLSTLGYSSTSGSSPQTESQTVLVTTLRLDSETENPVADPDQLLQTTPKGSGTKSTNSEKEVVKPILLDPRPFSVSTRVPSTTASLKPVTTETTTTRLVKVSENSYRLRARPRGTEGTTTTTEKISPQSRTRSPNRFRATTSAYIADQQASRSTINPSLRARKRFSTTSTTEGSRNNYNDENDLSRTYRPSGIADLSSLTAVDFGAVKDLNRFAGPRQRRTRPTTLPLRSTTSGTEPENDEASLKTDVRTPSLTRRTFNTSSTTFGRSRRPATSKVEDQLKSGSDFTSRIRSFTRAIPTTQSTESTARASLKPRKVIRRFRPTSSTISSTTESQDLDLEKSSSINPARRRLVRPTSSATEAASVATTENSRKNPLVYRRLTRPLGSTRSNDTNEAGSESESTNEITENDDISIEEGENIKLSESNIRENNDVNNNNVISGDGKIRRKVLKRIKSKAEDDEISEQKEKNAVSTEPNIIVRTRKIVRKLKPTEATLVAASGTTTGETDVTLARKRKIIRRLRPSSTEAIDDGNEGILENVTEDEKQQNKTLFTGESSFTTPSGFDTNEDQTSNETQEAVEKEKSNKGELTKEFKSKYKTISRSTTPKTEVEQLKDSSIDEPKFKPKTLTKTLTNDNSKNKFAVDRSKYSTINRGTTTVRTTSLADFEENDEEEDSINGEDTDKVNDEEEKFKVVPKYRIYRPTKTQSQEDSQDEAVSKHRISNSTLSSKNTVSEIMDTKISEELPNNNTDQILQINNDVTENGTVVLKFDTENDNTANEEVDEETSTVDPDDNDDDDKENVGSEIDEPADSERNTTVSNYKNPILEKQKSRPAFVRPKISTPRTLLSTTSSRARFRSRFSTTERNDEKTQDKTEAKFVPRTFNRGRYTSISRGGSRSTTAGTTTLSTTAITSVSTEASLNTTLDDIDVTEPSNVTEITTVMVGTDDDNSTETFIPTTVTEGTGTTFDGSFYISTEAVSIDENQTTLIHKERMSTDVPAGTTDANTIANTEFDTTTEELKFTTSASTTEEYLTSSTDNVQSTTTISPSTSPSTTQSSQTKSTLRSLLKRPKFLIPKKSTPLPDTTTIASSNRFSTSQRSKLFGSKQTTTSFLKNKYAARYSTTERTSTVTSGKDEDEDFDQNGPEIEQNENEEEEVTRPSKPGFRPQLYSPKPGRPRASNKPAGLGFRQTTLKPKSTDGLSDVNTEAVKNRNKNLFSKNRKMNTPFSGSASGGTTTESTEESVVVTEAPSTTVPVTRPSVTQETTEYLTTLHHVFSETETSTEKATTERPSANVSSYSKKSKVEKLIEINVIKEVHAKEDLQNNTENDSKVLDKLGAINRVTNIKVVDPKENEILLAQDGTSINNKSETTEAPQVTTTGVFMVPEIAVVQEIPHSEIKGSLYNIPDKYLPDSVRQERKFEIYSNSKVADYSQKGNGRVGSLPIIDGISHINVITPRPYYDTEASTISLESLFHTGNTAKSVPTSDDELLETGNSRYVNIRVLGQDRAQEEATMKAEVVEIPPQTHQEIIKIVPIWVEMSKRLIGSADFATKSQSGVPKVDLKLIEPHST